MAKRLHPGSVIPEFKYDTPYRPQQSFYELLEGETPTFFVFLRNFGHPITRHYIMRYIETADELRSARLVCVVRTRPHVIADAIPEGMMPYELMCDAEGVLYKFFNVPMETSKLKSYSLEALKILKAAQKQGFTSAKNEPQQLPLTLLTAPGGRVLFTHYGESLTDLPADCEAMQHMAEELLPHVRPEWLAGLGPARSPAYAAAALDESVEIAVDFGEPEPQSGFEEAFAPAVPAEAFAAELAPEPPVEAGRASLVDYGEPEAAAASAQIGFVVGFERVGGPEPAAEDFSAGFGAGGSTLDRKSVV